MTSSDHGEEMVQRTNAAQGGRESVSVMKGEVDSSILSGSTKYLPQFRSRSGAAYDALTLRPCIVAVSIVSTVSIGDLDIISHVQRDSRSKWMLATISKPL